MVDSIVGELYRSRRPYREVDLPAVAGLYAFFLAETASLPPFCGPGDLVYVGKSESSLKDRDLNQHFQVGASGHSTVRRPLGAILRREEGFKPLPRGPRRTAQDLRCYRFRQEDEEALSAWMQQSLEIGYVALVNCEQRLPDLEESVLAALVPPLNIDGRSAKRNPLAQTLLDLRAGCREEAERAPESY